MKLIEIIFFALLLTKNIFPDPIKNFINIFSKLPSIGPRQATRLAFYFISRGKNALEQTSRAIADLKNIDLCSECFYIVNAYNADQNAKNLCHICADLNREKNVIMIVEKETDLTSIERTKNFHGRYLVLGELTKNGVLESNHKLRLNVLKNFIRKEFTSPSANSGQAQEIIIATNPTTYGDLNAMVIKKELEGFAQKFSRLGRGIPTGGEIEFADEETLEQALKRRD